MHAREQVLDALRVDPASEGSIFDVLLATSTDAAPFRGRLDDLARLGDWWDDPKQRPVVVVTGPAGTGKTRLVTQFALKRPEPWVSGWLSDGRGADAVATIRACGDPALILVDDADQRPDLAALLASLAADQGTRSAVRVILISRAPGLVNLLAPALDDRSRGMLDSVRELPLGPVGGTDDRARWFTEAIRVYARVRQVPPPDMPAHLGGYITNPAEPILTLHAQALLAVLDSEGSRPMIPRAEGLPFDRVAAALFAHEQHRWQTSARRSEFGLTDLTSPVQAHAIAALLLAGPAHQAQAAEVLRCVPELAEAPAERRANIARWAAQLYPSDPPWPLQIKPDMLAEWFAVTQVTQTPELAGLLRVMTPAQEVALLVLFAHASDHIIRAVQLFADIVAADTTRLAEAGVAAALTATAGRRRLDGELASLISQAVWSADALGRIKDKLTERLPRTRVAVGEALVKIARAEGDAADLAAALQNLGFGLGALGRYQDALAATEESVDLWRTLVGDNPAYQPDLALALHSLGDRLGVLGRHPEALPVGEESVGLWRPLARDNPAHQDDLARALHCLGNRLDALGRHQDGLAAAEESVGLWRVLARDNSAHQPDLAAALDSLGIRLGALGRHQEALAAAEESVGLWRPLARDNPAHQPNLARTLHNLGYRLGALGRRQEALAAAEESVGLWRVIARDNPAHQHDLALALHKLGDRLGALGRHQDGLATTEESVGLWRPLARDNPAHQHELASALNCLGNRLGALGRHQDGLAAAEESVGVWRMLAQENAAQYQEIYNRQLAQLRRNLHLLGQERASIWLHLDDDSPDLDKSHHVPPTLKPPKE